MKNKKNAIKGKIPLYKFIGNIVLTNLTNFVIKLKFSDCHTGYWVYRVDVLKKINIKNMTNALNFDQEMRFEFLKKNFLISEISIKTIYLDERSSFHLVYAIRYFFNKS